MGWFNSTTRTHTEEEYQTLEITCSYQKLLGLLRDLRHLQMDYLDISLADGTVMHLTKDIELTHVILKSPKLLYYTKEYFKNSVEALTFVVALKKSLISATMHDVEVANKTKFQDLESSADKFGMLFEKHNEMLNGLNIRDLKLQKKLRSVRAWRKASSIVCKVASVATAICSLVVVAVGIAPAAAALGTATAALKVIENLLDSLLSDRERAFGDEHQVIREMLVLFVTNQQDCFQVIIKQLNNYILSVKPGEDNKHFDGFGKLMDVCMEEMISMIGEFLKISFRNDT